VSDPGWARVARPAAPTREGVLGHLEALLEMAADPLRIVARQIQGLDGEIAAVACDREGAAVVVGYADSGEELGQLGHLLAQRSWLAPRIQDWLQLNPQLPLRADRTPRLLLLGAEFGPAVLAAARGLGGVALARVRALESERGVVMGLEPVAGGEARAPEAPRQAEGPPGEIRDPAPRAHHPSRSTFRTGLHPEDLEAPRRPRSAPRGR
jgi:hypothetical protein